MTWWSAEQALAWIMWRDETRVAETGDGRAWTLLPRDTAAKPELTNVEVDEIAAELLEHGIVEQHWPDTSEAPYPGRELRIARHAPSGCVAVLQVRRDTADGPPRMLGELGWRLPTEEAILDLGRAMEALRPYLSAGRVSTRAQIEGETVEVLPDDWVHRTFTFSIDENVGGYMFIRGLRAIQLRFDEASIMKLFPLSRAPRELTGAAAGMDYRPSVIAEVTKLMNDRASKGRTVTDDDIKVSLEERSAVYDVDGGPVPRTIKRWAAEVRQRMAESNVSSS